MMLTLWWVIRREAPELRRFQVTAVISVCSVQNRKMQTAMAVTVLAVRIQLRLRCFRTNGANFIINPSIFAKYAFFQVLLRVCPVSGARIVGHHDNGLAELMVESLHQVEDFLGALGIEVAGGLVGDSNLGMGHPRAR